MSKAKSRRSRGGLTEPQKRFVSEYLIDLNGKAAAIRAGYSQRTAKQQAYQLKKIPAVQDAIDIAIRDRRERVLFNADCVLFRLLRLAHADIADILAPNGSVLPADQWPDEFRMGLVKTLKMRKTTVKNDKSAEIDYTEISLVDRVKILELIGKHTSVSAFSRSQR